MFLVVTFDAVGVRVFEFADPGEIVEFVIAHRCEGVEVGFSVGVCPRQIIFERHGAS
jgi:hypothetical protein